MDRTRHQQEDVAKRRGTLWASDLPSVGTSTIDDAMLPLKSPIDLDAIEIADKVSLIVVWPGGKGFGGGEVRVAEDVAGFLLTACFTTVELMKQRDPREYYPDMHLEEEELLIVNDEDLVADFAIVDVVLPWSPLCLVNARSLPRGRLLLYAATILSEQGPVAFVRKANRRTGSQSGNPPWCARE